MHKRGQEEMTGFVLVIIVVAVLALILITLSLHTASTSIRTDNYEIRQFLDSAMKVTSDCALRSALDYAALQDLARACSASPQEQCMDGRSVCTALNTSITETVHAGLQVGPTRPHTGFMLNLTFERTGSAPEPVLALASGTCDSQMVGGEYIIRDDVRNGLVVATLLLCS